MWRKIRMRGDKLQGTFVRYDIAIELSDFVPDTFTTRAQLDRAGMHIVDEKHLIREEPTKSYNHHQMSKSDRTTAEYFRSQE